MTFKKLFFSLLILFSVPTLLTAQVSTEKPVIQYDGMHTKYILGGLAIDPVLGIDPSMLEGISGLEVGKAYQVPGSEISEAIRKYWDQKLFSDVRIEADSIVGHHIYLRIKLKAQPRLSSLKFTGLKKSERTDVEKILGLSTGAYITPDVLDRTKLLITRHFNDKGFKNNQVSIKQRDDITADNRVLLDIDVKKNSKVKVRKIYISGVPENMQGKLKRAMKKTKEKTLLNLFRSRKFIPEKYEEDKGFLIDRMNEAGYRDALLVKDSVVAIDDRQVDVYLDMHQGNKYYVRNVEYVGNTVYPTTILSRTLQMNKGDVYNQKQLEKRLQVDDDAVHNLYYNNGYVFSNVQPVEVNVVGDSVDLEIRIVEGQQATFDHVRIIGNDRVYDNVIRRELRTKPGDLFSMDAIKRTMMSLGQMNMFDNEALANELNKSIRPNESNGTVDITYPVKYKGADQFSISAGWGPTGVVGTIGVKFNNFSMKNLFRKGKKQLGFLPQGDGQTFALSGQTNGRYYQSYSFQFLDPWFGGKRPNQFSISMYYSKSSGVSSRYYSDYGSMMMNNYLYGGYGGYGTNSSYYDYSNFYDPEKYVRMFGASIGFGKRLRWPDDYFTASLELSYTRYMLKNWNYFLITNGSSNNVNFTLSLNRNSTDNTFFPRRGSDFQFSVSATPPYSLWDKKDYKNLATDYRSVNYQKESQDKYRWIEYHKWKFKFRTFTALANIQKTPVLMTRIEMGILGAYNRWKKSPFEAYYMGGDGMGGYNSGYATETIGLRGYENGSIAGMSGNNAYAYSRMTMELRFPILLEGQTNVFALGFVEGGNAWEDVKKFNPFDMKRSAGLGVRLMLPMVGMLGIDWAYGFQKNFGGQKYGGSHFHFILNQEF